jgi:hypothetical protein
MTSRSSLAIQKEDPNQGDLKWLRLEKAIARKAFDAALGAGASRGDSRSKADGQPDPTCSKPIHHRPGRVPQKPKVQEQLRPVQQEIVAVTEREGGSRKLQPAASN